MFKSFDIYSSTFEKSLVEKLGYSAPVLIAERIFEKKNKI